MTDRRCQLDGLTLSSDRRRLDVEWSDGARDTVLAAWLFDNAEAARDTASGQRRHGALDLRGAQAIDTATQEADRVSLRFSPGGAEAAVTFDRLRARLQRLAAPSEPWSTPGAFANLPPVDVNDYLGKEEPLAEVLSRVARHGLAFLDGGGDQSGLVERIVGRFGFIRETNYGRLFDVRAEARPSNLAYTSAGLDLHTDNPYRDPTPSLQLLHVLKASAAGGESLFADGLAQAGRLAREAPAHFEILSREPVAFTYRSPDGRTYTARFPILQVGPDGAVAAVRFNHRSLAPLDLPADRMEAWYAAYLDLHARLHAPDAVLRRRLAPGDVVIFDNLRILHGRGPFDDADGRWLQGCYADRDGLHATLEG